MNSHLQVFVFVILFVAAGFGGYGVGRISVTINSPEKNITLEEKKTRNMSINIEHHCRLASIETCSTLSGSLFDTQAKKLKELHATTDISECAEINQAVQNCDKNYPNHYMECFYDFCEFLYYKLENGTSEFPLWLQDNFTVTKKNIEQVKANPKGNKYGCVNDERNEISVNSFCFKKHLFQSYLERIIYKRRQNSFTEFYNYLPSVSERPTILVREISDELSFEDIPNGVGVYTSYGKNVQDILNDKIRFRYEQRRYRRVHEDVFVLPSPLKVTTEVLLWMSDSSNMSEVICNVLGYKKLDADETLAFSNQKSHFGCFYNELGEKINESTNYDAVWALGKDFATSKNYLNTQSEEMRVLLKNRDFIYLEKDIQVPSEWLKLTNNIYLRKNSSRVLKRPDDESRRILQSEETEEFLREKDSFLIAENVEIYYYKWHVLRYLNYFLFYNKGLTIAENMVNMEAFRDNLFKSYIGQVFYVKFAQIPSNELVSLSFISNSECQNLIKDRNDYELIECGEFQIKLVTEEEKKVQKPESKKEDKKKEESEKEEREKAEREKEESKKEEREKELRKKEERKKAEREKELREKEESKIEEIEKELREKEERKKEEIEKNVRKKSARNDISE